MILAALVVLAAVFAFRWFQVERGRAAAGERRRPGPIDLAIGAVANFFDTLGIGAFATTTAAFKLLRRVPDEQIPGTLNVGHALPTMAQALIFIAVVDVEPLTLVSMIAAAVAGAWIGVGFAARAPRRGIQLIMGLALLVAAGLFLAAVLGVTPAGGDAKGLVGAKLALAVGANFVLGALMMLGIGLYAPCLILVALLGMSPLVAFPIMMGSCAFLMPVGGARFVASGRYSLRAAAGLAVGGIPAVLVAAYVVKSLPLDWLRVLVIVVAVYAAISMLWSARRA
ncbi:MAG: sulfite exporter TauE/SafE family protein [Alphaproteobacteria bacterium]|nr:sulfite exporter TauE/SafE family protein [Alphaproteobacteria bacterium]MBU1516100.1 sulfite exporter TauE/SafE family protein [Alphaproteobacteria bacterium]MBU2092685.1 sulfite exporter TauE/SafE family protein [Alphaproteobacteria bacterium]MBU2153790.1 sulfite exporter TauE/SafE family protein [Alphaproteobacteria bacterium]MBU2308418.1 sulfite exporter TauE/SafE family protein [Alphaproteobacteria bacterium]